MKLTSEQILEIKEQQSQQNSTKRVSSKHQLFIVDACFSGALIKYNLRENPWKNNYLHKKGLHALTSVRYLHPEKDMISEDS